MKFIHEVGEEVRGHLILAVEEAYSYAYSKQKGKKVRSWNPRVTVRCCGCSTTKTINATQLKYVSCDTGPCHPRWVDMTGEVYGELTVVKPARLNHKQARHWGWECVCACGAVEILARGSLLAGKKACMKCMNMRKAQAQTLPGHQAAKNRILRQYKRNAGNRHLSWELTDAQALEVMSGACYYCGAGPVVDSDRFTRNSIDRLDNEQGYTVDNTVPACFTCNRMKHVMSPDEFLAHVQKIVNFNRARSTTIPQGSTSKRMEMERVPLEQGYLF